MAVLTAVAASCAAPAIGDPMRPFSIWPAQPFDVAVPVTAPIYVPEISRALRAKPVATSASFRVEVTVGRPKGSPTHRLLQRSATLPAFDGSYDTIPAIVVKRGRVDLQTLAKQSGVAPHLKCEADHCTLSSALLVAKGAELLIDNTHIDLIQQSGAMIVNYGHMTVRNSYLQARMPVGFSFGKEAREFRPFLSGQEGSDTHLIGSVFKDLGYNRPSSYGVSIDARTGEAEPTGVLVGNVFDGLYYGFYSHHAKNVPIVDNLYRDNIIYGIDPHDYSYNLWILGNRAYGTKKKHGIIISRGVHDTVIAMNRSHDNARAGIMLDRHSSNNTVIYNHNWRNGYDGIAIYESSGNLIAHNTGVENGKTGLRIRNSQDLIVAHNYFSGNVTGIKAYTGRPNGFERRDEDIYRMEVQANLMENTVSANHREDLSLKGCVSRMVFTTLSNKQPGFTTPNVRFGGDKTWKEMLRRVSKLTYGDLEVRYDCEVFIVEPAVERAERDAALASAAAEQAARDIEARASLRQ